MVEMRVGNVLLWRLNSSSKSRKVLRSAAMVNHALPLLVWAWCGGAEQCQESADTQSRHAGDVVGRLAHV